MRLRKKWLFVNLIIILLTLILYICYVQKNNALFVRDNITCKKEKLAGTIIGYYDSQDEALNMNSIEVAKKWEFANTTYILDVTAAERGSYDMSIYKLYSEKNQIVLSETPIKRQSEGGYHSILLDRDWYDTQIIKDIMYAKNGDHFFIRDEENDKDIFLGLWFGEGINKINFEKGDFNFEIINNSDDCYLWTYELEKSDELLGDIGAEKIQLKENGEEQFRYYEYKLRDVKKALGVTYDSTLSVRVIVFLLLIVSSVIISITFTVLFLRKYGNTDILSRNIVILIGAIGIILIKSSLFSEVCYFLV